MKRCPTCQTTFPSDYTLCPRDGSSLTTVGEWAEGSLVRGKYRILAKVGQGGMGAVYKAMHTRFKEVRALKVISPELATDATFVKRFEQEAIITRKLQHPNAVRVEDIDEAEDGRPFIVMEYIEGRSLKDVIEQEAPMSVPRVCSIAKQVAAALDAAHGLGLIHRDIKPANIALVNSSDDAGERAKVLDFGIAKLKEAHLEDSKANLSHMTLTGTGVVVGTPAYMSPEQARGLRGEQLDGRSDIYSLGIVMYQMLTGELPLKADSAIEQLMAHINMPPRPIRDVRPDIPPPVAAVIMQCLHKDRLVRPGSGQKLVDDIDASNRAVPQTARLELRTAQQIAPQPQTEASFPTIAPVETTTRSRMWLWATLLLLTGVGLGVWLLRGRAPQTDKVAGTPAPRSETKTVEKGEVSRAAASPPAQPKTENRAITDKPTEKPAGKPIAGSAPSGTAPPTVSSQPATSSSTSAAEPILSLRSDRDKFSYAVGMNLGMGAKRQSIPVDVEALVRGFNDSLAGNKTMLTDEEAGAAIKQVQDDIREKRPEKLEQAKSKVSYALGMKLGQGLKSESVEVDGNLVVRGLKDALAGGQTLMTPDEAQSSLTKAKNVLQARKQAEDQRVAEANKKDGDAFLAANRGKEGVTTLPSGLQYKILKEGTGPKPIASDSVVCNYRGTLVDGKEFDSSYKRGQPATFPVSAVIKGWTEALQLMPVGSKWELFIPPDLAYGDRGAGGVVPPGATLIFEVELISIQHKN